MKTFFVLCVSVVMLYAADQPATKAKARAKAKPAATAVAPQEIPAAAVPVGNGDFRLTDAQGKKWLYRKTPFGVSRREDTPENAEPIVAAAGPETADKAAAGTLKATEDGDTVRFERGTPFGVKKWQKKKTELDAGEQAAWDRERARAAGKKD